MKRLAILDDVFPSPLSAFRYEEFRAYLEQIPGSCIYSDGSALHLLRETRMVDALVGEYIAANPGHADSVRGLRNGLFPIADAYYAIFLNNIVKYVAEIERVGKPFAFTLYPGGGFQLYDDLSDAKLKRVCNSRSFRHVIVTQPCTYSYLISKGLSAAKITFLPGVVVPRAAFSELVNRPHFSVDKKTLDIGFIANRYTPRGEDKGYDLFVETAAALQKLNIRATYHVIGPWDASVIPLGNLAESFLFYGNLPTEKLQVASQNLDLILSPNRPNRLAKGAFDGFPTGCCVEAGLQEAAVFCTDPLMLNTTFEDGTHIAIIRPTLESILDRLLPFIKAPSTLAELGRKGRTRMMELYGAEAQLGPRISLLRSLERVEEMQLA